MTDKEGIIKSAAIFSGLDTAALKEIGKSARIVEKPAGTLLFSEGDDAKSLFILAEGSIELVKMSPNGKEQMIRTVKTGETFAEAAMFSGLDYPVSALVRKNSSLIVIDKKALIDIISKNPEISLKMMGSMANLLRHLGNLVMEMTLTSVTARLATYLLKRSLEAKSRTFSLGIPKKELARKLGTISETISRNFKKLKDDGIIKVEKDKITILDIESLKELS